MKIKKSQGEIFGVALMFVIIILGIVIYGRIVSQDPNTYKNPLLEKKYKILAEGTLNTILKTSTNCYPERNKDSISDLIKYCIENSIGSQTVYITCEGSLGVKDACKYPVEVLNETLLNLYNNSNNNFHIPYVLNIYLEENITSPLSKATISNFGSVKLGGKIITKANYKKLLINKAPSGLYSIPSSKRQIKFDFSLYYK